VMMREWPSHDWCSPIGRHGGSSIDWWMDEGGGMARRGLAGQLVVGRISLAFGTDLEFVSMFITVDCDMRPRTMGAGYEVYRGD
jgi:hypothetical protein